MWDCAAIFCLCSGSKLLAFCSFRLALCLTHTVQPLNPSSRAVVSHMRVSPFAAFPIDHK